MDRKFIFKSLLLLILTIFTIFPFYLWQKVEKGSWLTVAFLDIGQGDSIFIESPVGNQLLIDGGPGAGVLRELSSVMPFYDRTIDVVLATHPDADHVGGLNDVLDNFSVSLFMEPGVDADTSVYENLEKKISEHGIKKILARRGMVLDLGAGAMLEILYPVGDVTGWETNDASIVARLVYGESEFLLTGDAPFKTERALMYLDSTGQTLRSDVLKAGHHGSKNSTSPEFVSAVSPEYAIISVGADNRYGHPTKEVLDILMRAKIKILRTDQDGRIIFLSDGEKLEVK